LLLFGKGKIPGLMSDVAKGIKSFKKDISDNDSSTDSKEDTKKED
jgi:sec-independent protein translocase protein TatA